MDGGIKRVKIGKHVDIKRSDGRIHSATISAICVDSNTVTVEWMENGETKGKEIDFDQLIGLNPTLLTIMDDPVTPPQHDLTIVKSVAAIAAAAATANANGAMKHASTDADLLKAKRRQTTTNIPALPALPVKTTAVKTTNGRAAVGERRMKAVVEHVEEDEQEMVQAYHNNNNEPSPLAATAPLIHQMAKPPSPVPGGGGADKRPSQTVKEIERLKKGREERRAKIEQQRHEMAAYNALLEQPGHANWEFARMIHDYRAKVDISRVWAADAAEDHKICVCVRKRPMSHGELEKREIDVITVPNSNHMIVHQPQTKVDLTKYVENQTFRFDYAFDETATNELVYKFSAQPLIRTIFERGFATCFAYGQTGSGKTHTMGGAEPSSSNLQGKSRGGAAMSRAAVEGIYAMAARDVFRFREQPQFARQIQVSCSFFEIYGSNVFDLLSDKRKLRVLEDGRQQVQVVGLREAPVDNEQHVLELIRRGSEVRTAGKTSVNERSSRSHAVFQIVLRQKVSGALHGKFSLVDLAGNERGADTGNADRQTRMEGAEINKSLLALKECIRALGRRNAHLPFRASKLTLVLRDSFIGDNARTCMIAMISPGLSSCENSLNTLRYANRVKELGIGGEAAGVDADMAQLSDDPDLVADVSDADSDASPADPEPLYQPVATTTVQQHFRSSPSTSTLLDNVLTVVDDAARARDIVARARRATDADSSATALRRLRDLIDDQADRWASMSLDVDRSLATLAQQQQPVAAAVASNQQRRNGAVASNKSAPRRY